MIQDLHISMIQSPIRWNDIDGNLVNFKNKLRCLSNKTDIAVLPETFTTGFILSISSDQDFKQNTVLKSLKLWSGEFNIAIIGSFITCENNYYYNRAFWVSPDGDVLFYDKRHLFRMGGENNYFTPGNQRLIIEYKGWKICPLICYDLRFPVWSRNFHNDYDVLIYVANWPASRRDAWKTLLKARAIENQVYVCGVNRIGTDKKGNLYSGDSTLFSYKGIEIASAEDRDTITTSTISYESLMTFRNKFPAWMDADSFNILP